MNVRFRTVLIVFAATVAFLSAIFLFFVRPSRLNELTLVQDVESLTFLPLDQEQTRSPDGPSESPLIRTSNVSSNAGALKSTNGTTSIASSIAIAAATQTNAVEPDSAPYDREQAIAFNLETRQKLAAQGRMQDVAQREAEILARTRALNVGMTVAETMAVMGEPHRIDLILPDGEFDPKGTVEQALRNPEAVWRLIYTPYSTVNLNRYRGPYLDFQLFFGRMEGEVRGELQHWTRAMEENLPPTPSP